MPRLSKPRGFIIFALVLLGLVVLDVILGVVSFPASWEPIVSPLVTAIYITSPIWALYEASKEAWTWQRAVQLILVGVAVHTLVLIKLPPPRTLFDFIWIRTVSGIIQSGLLTWCLGL